MRQKFTVPRVAGGDVELLSVELLEEHARRLAALLSIAPRGSGPRRAHLRRLKEHMRALREIYAQLAEDARQEAVSPAAEWLLDNFHVVSAAARDIHHDLPPSFFKRLPRVAADEFAGLPRIYALALELIGSSAGRLDAQRLQRFIGAFQSITPLTIGELWAWPSVLKLALIDYLRERADVLAETRAHRVAADRLASAIESVPDAVGEWPAEVHPAFVTRLLRRSRALGGIASTLHRQLDAMLSGRGETMEDAIRIDGQHQAAEQAGVANLITSLRFIGTFDWSEFFESVSLVEQVLQRDPAGVYSQMDFRSRDRYRHAVEELARPTGEAQLLLALKSVERARQVHVRTPDDRAAHVGYHLIGAGRRAFERSVAWQPDLSHRVRRLFFAWATPIYLGSVAAGTALLVAAAVGYAAWHGWRGARLGVRGAADGRARQRAGDPAVAAADQLPDSAAPAAAHRARRCAGVGAHDGDRADAARQRRARRGADRAPRGPGARQSRPADPFRPAQRLSGCRHRDAAAGRRDPRGGPQPASPRSTSSTAAATAAAASSCFTGCGSGTPARACGWGGSASGARSRSSTGSCAAPPTRASPCRSAICRSCPTSSTASRSTATRGCRAASRAS